MLSFTSNLKRQENERRKTYGEHQHGESDKIPTLTFIIVGSSKVRTNHKRCKCNSHVTGSRIKPELQTLLTSLIFRLLVSNIFRMKHCHNIIIVISYSYYFRFYKSYNCSSSLSLSLSLNATIFMRSLEIS